MRSMESIRSLRVIRRLLPILSCVALSCDASEGATRPGESAPEPVISAVSGTELDGAAGASPDEIACAVPEALGALPRELPEASGITAASRRGQVWTHNDSERPPALYRLDAHGRVAQRVVVTGVRMEDWEDVASARCAGGTCLYLADIGDNLHTRPLGRIVRVREPAPRDTSVRADRIFYFRYPDGPTDAEALFVLPGERAFVITKGRNRAAMLYRYPGPLRADTVTLEPVRALTDGIAQFPDMVTGAAATPDGHYVAVRRYGYLELFRVRAGALVPGARVDLGGLGERQGEGLALHADGELVLVSERGPGGAAGTLARVRCMLR